LAISKGFTTSKLTSNHIHRVAHFAPEWVAHFTPE
jgi:hypothetical protein